jgi:N-methylhydantoinase A
VLVPRLAPVLSAFGAATTDVRRERICPVLATFPVAPATLEKLARELAAAVDADLAHDGVDAARRSVTFEVDMRFAKQVFELPIPLAVADPTEATMDTLLEQFRSEYSRRYGPGSIVLGSPVEIVSLRAVGTGATPRAQLERVSARAARAADGVTTRPVRFDRGPDGVRAVPAHASESLGAGDSLSGPALVDAPDTTVWIPTGATARVDDYGTLVLEVNR